MQRKAIQRTGLVRYNPFEDTGGNQSFAVALLDANGDGVVVSSLHARNGTRIYAKAIAGGPLRGGPLRRGERGAPPGDGAGDRRRQGVLTARRP